MTFHPRPPRHARRARAPFAHSGRSSGNSTPRIEVDPCRLKNSRFSHDRCHHLAAAVPARRRRAARHGRAGRAGRRQPPRRRRGPGRVGRAVAARAATGRPLPDPRRDRHDRAGRPAPRRCPRRRAAGRRACADRVRRARTRGRALGRGRDRSTTEPLDDHAARAGRGVQERGHRDPAAARRLAGDRHRPAGHRPLRARRHGRLRAVPHRRAEA